MNRRNIVRAGLSLGAIACLPRAVMAQVANAANSYPERPIRIVVPYPPGGFNDTLARTVGKHLTAEWKQAVLVDNKPGGNTVIGNVAVATAAADGYTLLLTPLPFSVVPALYGSKLPYDAVKSFRPVIWAAYSQNLLVVHKGFPAKTVTELRAQEPWQGQLRLQRLRFFDPSVGGTFQEHDRDRHDACAL